MSKKLDICNVATSFSIKFYSKLRQCFKQQKTTNNTSKVLVFLHHYVKTLVKVHRGYLSSGYDWNSMVVSTFTSMYPLGRCTKSSRLIDYYLDSLRSVTPTTQPSRITRQENTDCRCPQPRGDPSRCCELCVCALERQLHGLYLPSQQQSWNWSPTIDVIYIPAI